MMHIENKQLSYNIIRSTYQQHGTGNVNWKQYKDLVKVGLGFVGFSCGGE